MSTIPMLLKEMEQEAQTTRKMLSIVPNDKYDWQPHKKSMTVQKLATHIAELPNWVTMAIHTDGLDFGEHPYEPSTINNTADLLKFFEESYENGRSNLAQANEEDFDKKWVLRNGDQVLLESTKGEIIRVAYSQTVHHRAQLGVFLRLLDIPIPGSYGPSADELGL
ncbi:Uncharacterized damage-inducible protein DinB (forms a four-helix bundle) [Mucilaginibacter pineti]|uniref:Uncharacterized damage-inducible protein DinB (Forms a four-helix bundle) n=1 Tax=Mucilaginibacter pineti TaxID=1391627 RepID=A0A1G7J3U1_9SPHI|nr:DinB family protein [Mucilaginibacter pineti]SDF19555.1 Uncharacterized damage-inducible protein DinB (forms a four-helix bundle) [Mucilaginibacter pineti]